ncbi:TPA: hypothetical protein ACH3X2_007167 [Trebouxia sp. C0005]
MTWQDYSDYTQSHSGQPACSSVCVHMAIKAGYTALNDYTSDQRVKHYLAKGRACICIGQLQGAADFFKQASKAHMQGSKELLCSIKAAITLLPEAWCAQYWSACITKAQEPNPLSSRDGRLLRPVPKVWKLPQAALMQRMQDAMHKIHSFQAGLLCTAWGSSGRPDKASLALMRGLTYAQAGKFEQALRDALVVLAYAPKQEGCNGICSWPWGHALHSAALEGLQVALEMDPSSQHHKHDMERLMRRIPQAVADVLEAGGSAGLKQWLADEAEQKKPEFLKQRPKYFYYYEWMKERICETHPALPELVMDKLLTMPAGDLDLILQHPQATTWKVDELMGVLEDQGPALLERYPLQGLSWEQVKELKGPNLVGLGVGSGPAPGEGLVEPGLDRHEQLKLEAQKQHLLGQGLPEGRKGSTCTHQDSPNAMDEDIDDEDLENIESFAELCCSRTKRCG